MIPRYLKLADANIYRVICVLAISSAFIAQSAEAQVIISRSFSLDGEEMPEGELSNLNLPIGPMISSAFGGGTKGARLFAPSPQLPNDTAALLRMPQIVEELGLDSAQIEAASELSKATAKQITDVIKSIDFGSDSGKVMREAQRTIRTKTKEKLEELLTPGQLERLTQIKSQSALNARGAMALTTGALDDAIRLTDKQKNLLRSVNAAKQKELKDEIARLEKQYLDETLEEVLTEDQQRELKSMLGKPYEVKQMDFSKMIQQSLGSRKQKTNRDKE